MTFAIHYSPGAGTRRGKPVVAWWLGVLGGVMLTTRLHGGDPVVATNAPTPAGRAEAIYRAAQAEYESSPTNSATALEFAHACFDWAEFAVKDSQRAHLADEGIAASHVVLAANTNSASGHYYLGMNLGQLARTKSLGALALVDDMEAEFKAARALDEHLDHAGPDRNLGQLYYEAPSIASIGSRSKARTHLRRALELAPDYPENRLNWIEACIHWHDTKSAREELETLEAGLAAARQKYAGPAWAAAWVDWDKRLEAVRTKLRPTHPVVTSPRGMP
jgi:hypothetical protein